MKNIFIVLFISLLAIPASAHSTIELDKTIKKSFPIDSDGTVQISNKFGNVNIQTGSGNTVEMEIKIVVKTKNKESADEIFNRVNIGFESGNSRVSATTEIDENSGNWWSKMWKGSSNTSFNVHYEVTMPASCKLDLYNKHGNSYVQDLENDASVSGKYGNIQLNNVGGALDLELKYGKGSMGNAGKTNMIIGYSTFKTGDLGDLNLEAKNSHLAMNEIGDLDLDMKYSDIKIQKLGNAQIESKYDDIDIEQADAITVECKFTNVKVKKLNNRANLETGYGSVKLYDIGTNFSEIKINSQYTGVRLGMVSGTNYELDFVAKYASLKGVGGIDAQKDISQGSERIFQGAKGSGGGKVYIRSKFGGLTIE